MILRAIIIFSLLISSLANAHVLPVRYDIFTHGSDLSEEDMKKFYLPDNERFYIKILPSPILEGFASYEFCPYLAGKNQKNKYIAKTYLSEQSSNKLDYHHDLINKDCIRPYGLDPLEKQVYFDVRIIDQILRQDETELLGKELAITGSSLAFLASPSSMLNPWVLGFTILTGAALEFLEEYSSIDDFNPEETMLSAGVDANFGNIPDRLKQQIIMKITRGDYFAGKQVQHSSDIYWPILPNNYTHRMCTEDGYEYEQKFQLFDECYRECKAQQLEQNDLIDERKKCNPLFIEPLVLKPTESIQQMDPFVQTDPCSMKCDLLPRYRPSMKNIWKELYLTSIYLAGYTSYQNPQTDEAGLGFSRSIFREYSKGNKRPLFDRYNIKGGLQHSQWETVVDASGKIIPNHYTNRWIQLGSDAQYIPGEIDRETAIMNKHVRQDPEITPGVGYMKKSWQSMDHQPLCDLKRFATYFKYEQSLGLTQSENKMGFAQWTREKCSFSKTESCREYLYGPIQRGQNICTIPSEN